MSRDTPRESRRERRNVALGVVARGGRGGVVLRSGLGRPAQPAQQVGAHGVQIAVAAAGPAPPTRSQRHGRAGHLGHRDRPVQRHDRRRRHRQQLVVERDDLRPVGVAGASAASLCTALIAAWSWYGPGLVAPQARADQRLPLGDQRRRPTATGPGRRAAPGRRPARSVPAGATSTSSISASRPSDLRLVGHQLGEQPAEPDRLGAQVVAHQRGRRTSPCAPR